MREYRATNARWYTARRLAFVLVAILAHAAVAYAGESPLDAPVVTLKAWGVISSDGSNSPNAIAQIKITREFCRQHPDIRLVPATGLEIPGRTMDTIPLMQIAADVSPAVIYVNFRLSSTYIEQRFLYPLDKYLERAAGCVDIRDGHLLSTERYVSALRKGPRYAEEFEKRLAPQCWSVIRRTCPYGEACPYVKEWGGTPAAKHHHVWALPQTQKVMALYYRKDLFAEAGLPQRAPADMDEFLDWARRIHNPKEQIYAVNMLLSELSFSTLSFFYSCGARAVEVDHEGRWRCVFNSPEAVDAYYYVARMFLEPFTNRHGTFEGVVNLGEQSAGGAVQYVMWFNYLDQKSFEPVNPDTTDFGPVPKGPGGWRGSEFNAQMTGIYAGFEQDIPMRDAAWKWMLFRGGPEADLIRAKVYAESGLARFVQPDLLDKAGYPEFKDQIPKGWGEASEDALRNGIPEPYGKNCQLIYRYMSQAIDQIRTDAEVKRCIVGGDEAGARKRIGEILDVRVEIANRKMLNILPPDARKLQSRVAAAVALAALGVFVLALWQTMRVFSRSMVRSEADRARGDWQFGRHKRAYLILLPAILSIAVWSYWPLLRGTVMGFQDYNVRGFSSWVGFDNFATVIFSAEFWHAMLISLVYTVLFMTVGFGAPIVLALLLTEVPKGKVLFRIIFYLPAMLAGVIVIFLWKGFYGQHGMINQMLNLGVQAINAVFGTGIAPFETEWLSSPTMALFFCVLPTIWAGMGPGCLIYLAALKGVPDDLYEAADIDGAGAVQKAWHIAIPSIRALIAINFIGASIGCMQSGSGFILAMTGGGPYTPYGATEVVGLHIFWEAFGYLRFGAATAMAWVLGSMLIGFTILQMQKLSRIEFKAAGGQ